MPSLYDYRIFISHAWKYGDDYNRLVNLLDQARYFSYYNYSAPKEKPLFPYGVGVGCGTSGPHLQLLGWPEDVEKVCLSDRQLGVLGDMDPILQAVLTGASTEPIPDGLHAMSLFYEPAASILDIGLGPPPWHLHDPESHLPGLWVQAVGDLLHRHRGLFCFYFGNLPVPFRVPFWLNGGLDFLRDEHLPCLVVSHLVYL